LGSSIDISIVPTKFFPSFDIAESEEGSVWISYIMVICENVLNADIWTA
jgi:hypothetical protein